MGDADLYTLERIPDQQAARFYAAAHSDEVETYVYNHMGYVDYQPQHKSSVNPIRHFGSVEFGSGFWSQFWFEIRSAPFGSDIDNWLAQHSDKRLLAVVFDFQPSMLRSVRNRLGRLGTQKLECEANELAACLPVEARLAPFLSQREQTATLV